MQLGASILKFKYNSKVQLKCMCSQVQSVLGAVKSRAVLQVQSRASPSYVQLRASKVKCQCSQVQVQIKCKFSQGQAQSSAINFKCSQV